MHLGKFRKRVLIAMHTRKSWSTNDNRLLVDSWYKTNQALFEMIPLGLIFVEQDGRHLLYTLTDLGAKTAAELWESDI